MKIRTITLLVDPQREPLEKSLPQLGAFAAQATAACEAAGIQVQTRRLATAPFPFWADLNQPASFVNLALRTEELAQQNGLNFLSFGPALPEIPSSFAMIPPALAATKNLFFSAAMTTQNHQISNVAVHACAEIITQCANFTTDGMTNLRFAALGNVPPGGPFFPAAYHTTGMPPAVAMGLECAGEILAIFQSAETLGQARQQLLNRLEKVAACLTEAIQPVLNEFSLKFIGFDFSSAPYPSSCCSVGGSLEALGVPQLGLHGSVAASAFLADTLKQGKWQQAGFNGLMLPVLEDHVLAQRSAEGFLSTKDLLLFACMCGTGLDTVPLPGDSSPQAVAALLLDLAAISLRLDKPLTARLMPIPGKKAGDSIEFNFEYLTNGKIMALEGAPLTGLLGRQAEIEIHPLH